MVLPTFLNGKYFDAAEQRPLKADDGCSIDEWRRGTTRGKFGIHPQGFLVFVPGSELSTCDEYEEGDPYTVERNAESPFHQRRLESTIRLVEKVSEDVPEPLKVLDVGCGEGHITSVVRQKLDGGEVSGLDQSITAISRAASLQKDVDFIVADAYDPPYAPGFFDLVICNNLWEHVPDPLRLLDGITRITRPGAHLVISTPSRYRSGNLLRVLQGKPPSLMSELHVTEYTVGQVIEQLRWGGWEVRQILNEGIERPIAGPASLVKKVLHESGAAVLRWIGSRHSLEGTVFFLARKRDGQEQ